MPNIGTVAIRDGANLDAFDRLRVSLPNSLFEFTNEYGKQTLVWSERILGLATSTANPNLASITLNTPGTASKAATGGTRATNVYTFNVAAHGLLVGQRIIVSVSNDTTALPLGTYTVVTVPTGGSFTVTSPNAGGTSALTATYYAYHGIARQTFQYFKYRPGKSHMALLTFNLGAAAANILKRAGYCDDLDGIFVEHNGTTVNIVRRSAANTGVATTGGTRAATVAIISSTAHGLTTGQYVQVYVSGDTTAIPLGMYPVASVISANSFSLIVPNAGGTSALTMTYAPSVDTPVAQASWNIDIMNGNGISGVNLDFTKSQIFIVDLEWLGVGRVRCGWVVDGAIYYCHQFLNANNLVNVYMATGTLPIRYEISNTGAAAVGSTSYDQICATVISEGGTDEQSALEHSVNMGVTTKNATGTLGALISIRPKATFNNVVNRTQCRIKSIMMTNSGNTMVRVDIYYGATLGGVPAWTSAGSNSAVEFDTAGTTITGGELVFSDYIPSAANGGDIMVDLGATLPFALDINGANPPAITVAVISTGANSACISAINFEEII